MKIGTKSLNDVRSKGFFVAVLIAFCGAYLGHSLYLGLTAKTPGESHCYGDVCHRVFSLEETRRLIGQTTEIVATHYDAPGVDKYNVGQYTSSGEEFDAENAARAAAVNYPDGTELLIWHPATRRAAHIRVNDFGPFMGKRTLDVTRKVAETMGWAKNGVATLKATVIWVPPSTDAKYKKGRTYPPSLGLIGVVESYQYATLAERLIATGPARNGIAPGPAVPNVPEVLASVLPPPPSFRSEGNDDADTREAEEAAAIARMIAQLPRVQLPVEPVDVFVLAAAPMFRSEAITDSGLMAAGESETLAWVIASLPAQHAPQDLPVDLMPPIVVAAVPLPVVVDEPVVSASVRVVQAGTGPATSNQYTLQPSAGETGGPVSQVVAVDSVEQEGANQAVASVAAPVEASVAASVTVAMSQSHDGSLSWSIGTIGLWIGIGLMLSTLWGVRSLNRSRRNGAIMADAVNSEPVSDIHLSSDVFATARLAVDKAEARARSVLAAEQASSVSSEAELLAREDLSRELALREFEREQEAATRTRAEMAAAAHEAAQRELAALEAGRATRRIELERQKTTLANSAARQSDRVLSDRVIVSAPMVARGPKAAAQPVPLRALANELEMARFPGVVDRALVGAILDLPGAQSYWGNTIIAQMRLDGSARSGSPLRIDGTVDGACTAPILLISEGAVVSGVVAAETIVVLGKVSGILAGRNVYVAATAQVDGEVFYQTISIDPHAHCDVSFSRLAVESDPIALGSSVYSARAAA